MTPDTSAEAVERLAALYSDYGARDDDLVAATLRALLVERDTARFLQGLCEAALPKAQMAHVKADRLAAENERLREALTEARDRIAGEEWHGECPCEKFRTGRCPCLEEHNSILARVDAALAGEGKSDG